MRTASMPGIRDTAGSDRLRRVRGGSVSSGGGPGSERTYLVKGTERRKLAREEQLRKVLGRRAVPVSGVAGEEGGE